MPSQKMQKPELAPPASAHQIHSFYNYSVLQRTILSHFPTHVNYHSCKKCNYYNSSPVTKCKKHRSKKAKNTAPRRFAIDIGKNISLALMAEKYDFDPRIDGGGGAE